MSNLSEFIGLGWVPLETIEVTTPVTTVDFDSNIDDTYNNYVLTSTHTLSGIGTITCQLKTSGALITAGYRYLGQIPTDTGTGTATDRNLALLCAYSGSFVTYFMNLRSSDPFKSINTQATGYSGSFMLLTGYNAALLSTSIIDGIQIGVTSSRTFNAGSKLTLYGIKEL